MDYQQNLFKGLLFLFATLLALADGVKVSFYGASHITMPIQEAKISTNVRLRFRTHQENALIFLSSGRTDFCLLALDYGRIKLNFKIDDYTLELWSPNGLIFNDLNWHDVVISRYESNFTMQIDEHFVRNNLPQNVAELNVHFGVFLGGVGEFTEAYLGALENFRGCISDVYYNNINIFKRARDRSGRVTTEKVSWHCAAEFDADEHQSISFIEDDSFIIYTKPTIRNGDSWNFELRTIEPYGTLLYNIAPTATPDFIGLEIMENKLRLLVGKGSNAVELIPDRNVSDGLWHNISLFYSPTVIEITIDETVSSATFANGSSQYIELGEEFFIGGLETSRRRKASVKGLRTTESSFRGCMRNISINNEAIGFPNFKVTHGLTVDCVWKYPCIEKQPCIMSSNCQQHGIDDFICYCEQAFCVRADFLDKYKVFTRSTELPSEIGILSVSPLEVMEGDSVFLSTTNIDILIDYSKIGVLDSGLLFHVSQAPKHGKITITPQEVDDTSTIAPVQPKFFSLVDLSTDKVKYTHNGQEHFVDHMTIDFQLVSSNRGSIPEFLEGRHRFVLHVNITPTNDAPFLTLPNNKLLRLTQGIPKLLGPELLTAMDPDSSVSQLMYSILASPNSDGQHGRLEVNGKAVNSFTQSDVNDGLVSYIVNTQTADDTSFEIAVQVSDGMETSPAVMLKVSVLPLQLRMINNTGLVLIHKSSGLITPWNLSFISNSEDDNIDVRFDIVQAPKFGYLQKLRSVDLSWITVDSFTSNQLSLGHLRYLHIQNFPQMDEFKFTATLGPVTTPTYDFRITFTQLKIGIQRQVNPQVNGQVEFTLTNAFLFHQTTPLPTFSRHIIYTVITAPKFGYIYVDGYPEYALPGDSFTQQDIDKNLMRYRTHATCYSSFIDVLEFSVSVPECEDVKGKLDFIFNPLESLSKQLTYQKREKMFVKEGGKSLLGRLHFDVLFNKFKFLSFNLTHIPKHGSLCLVSDQEGKVEHISSFTLDSLYLDDVFYCHDDSESTEDAFRILVVSDNETDFQYVSEVFVEIELENDNGPYRVFDNPFHIVREESKMLTGQDLKYADPDIDTSVNDIIYTHVSPANGEVIKAGVNVNSFSQDDLDQRIVLFKHKGADSGQLSFIVTDGVFEVPGHLNVMASDPFLKVRENNASIVQEGKMVLITKEDLSVDTNLNAKPEDVEYKIVVDPSYGVLKLFKRKFNETFISRANNATSALNFTQADIEKERLVYWNTDVASMDKIKYKVSTKGVGTEGELLIRIYPAAYWESLQVRKNNTLYVEESTSVTISREVLEIAHPNISPGDITYLVNTSPQHGYLEIQSITSDDEYNSKVFDQSTINSEKMFYIQAGVNQSTDCFTFDVTNGITWLRDLMLKIVIIPEHLYIEAKHLVVEEGKIIKLLPEDIIPFSEYYVGKIIEYKILEHPKFGSIKSGKSSKVNRFTQKQLEAGVVQYIHDGSENASDVIRMIALGRNKESVPFELTFDIIPINDEVPQVITNTGLQIWIGGNSVIKNTDLMAQDYDTPPKNLTFIIQQIIGGFVSVNGEANSYIHNFTQQDINDEKLHFIHDSNHLNGKIKFYVTDGIHNTSEQVLYIITNHVTLELVKNEFIHVFPLTRKQILPEQLHYVCSDPSRDTKFVVSIPPQLGRLVYEYADTGYITEINDFTQRDIETGRIFYEHTHPMVELRTNDSFLFDVSAPMANSLVDQNFNIDISVSSGGLLRFLPVPRITIDEGDIAPVKLDLSKVLEYLETRAGIYSPELYIESFTPAHGVIETTDSRTDVSQFSLNDFYTNKVLYRHDHSDTVDDKISLAVYLLPGHVFLCNITIPVNINPINDQPFTLVTISPKISVIEGENVTITRDHLLTKDADTPAKEIRYDVISAPTQGVLFKISDEGYPHDIMTYGNQFSQSDINDQRIVYTHSGKPHSTSFYFKVSDGKFKPAFEIFNISILPITVFPGTDVPTVFVQQGSNMAELQPQHISVDTNVQKSRLMYNITRTPSWGMVVSHNKPTLRFNQKQLEDGKISYMQTDMSVSNDTFQVIAYIPDTSSAAAINVYIVVQPFIAISQILVIPGEKVRLSSKFVLDNPSQTKLNRYNPKIVITKKPKYGRLKKIIRSTGDLESVNDKEVSAFTYKELKSGAIYFVARKFSLESGSINDSFEYLLTTKSAQPGQGVVPIELYSPSLHGATLDGVDIVHAQSSLPINLFVLVLFLLLSFLILILIILIIIKCRSSNPTKNDPDKDLPPSLPRPPDFMTLNHNRMYTPSDNDSLPITTASTPLPVLSNIPHCKVIPIGLDSCLQDSDPEDMMDMNIDILQNTGHIRYPYGEDPEDWSSSCDIGPDVNYSTIAQPQQNTQTQQRANPLLRRNQYWV